jgi:tetratricopeptide (TPR) repeat protein
VLKFYEIKQYKKALKAADTILKKVPTHGETLAMKGLTYNNLKRSEEAHALVKKGLAMNIKSHICWHVYGLLYRSESKYAEAIRCYQNAIKRDPVSSPSYTHTHGIHIHASAQYTSPSPHISTFTVLSPLLRRSHCCDCASVHSVALSRVFDVSMEEPMIRIGVLSINSI